MFIHIFFISYILYYFWLFYLEVALVVSGIFFSHLNLQLQTFVASMKQVTSFLFWIFHPLFIMHSCWWIHFLRLWVLLQFKFCCKLLFRAASLHNKRFPFASTNIMLMILWVVFFISPLVLLMCEMQLLLRDNLPNYFTFVTDFVKSRGEHGFERWGFACLRMYQLLIRLHKLCNQINKYIFFIWVVFH